MAVFNKRGEISKPPINGVTPGHVKQKTSIYRSVKTFVNKQKVLGLHFSG